MYTEKRNNGLFEITVLCAEEDKVLVRVGYENELIGKEISLGKSYYIGGVLQNPPHIDTVEDFTEVDKPSSKPDNGYNDAESSGLI